jgi:1,2-diacylglycerol 3-alpha-glucosyltransferase
MFTETWLPTRDGVVTSLCAFREGLESLGHEVFIFAAGSEAMREANTDARVRFYTGPTWGPYPDYHLAARMGPSARLLRSLKVDVVHSHGTSIMGIKAVRAARFGGIPILLTYHTRVEDATGYVTKHKAREALLRRLIWTWHRWYFRQCDAIVMPTLAVKSDLLRQLHTHVRRSFVIPTGIDLGRFAGGDGAHARAAYGLEGGRLVLTVGRAAWEKNLETLVAAAEVIARKRDDVTFAVAGRGPALEHFKAEVERRGLSRTVRFLGFVPDGDLPSLYRAADAFLMPSTFETQGIALLEAMAAGLPVAAPDTGGPTHFVRSGENGFLFAGKDAQACAGAVLEALSADEALRARARETAQRYSIESQTRELVGAYAEVIAARRRPDAGVTRP